ncbi:hypothetical protein JCM8547_005296 [Rhodosporidiobolus lusitaniae]
MLESVASSLKLLVEAEEIDAKRIRTSRVGWWRDVHRIQGSTLNRTYKAMIVFTAWATAVAVADLVYGKDLGLTNNVTPMLSVVVGLLLVFRNGSAYARWDDGRKTFAKLLSVTRNLSRTVWINIGAPPPASFKARSFPWEDDPSLTEEEKAKKRKEAEQEEVRRKKKDEEDKVNALRLMVAFVVATKHHVRREYGTDYADLASVLPHEFLSAARSTGFGRGAAEADHHTPPPPSHPPLSPTLSSHSAPPFPPPSPGLEPISSEIRRLSSARSASSLLSAAEEGRPTSTGTQMGERAPLLEARSQSWAGGRRGVRREATGMSTDSMIVLADYMAKPSLPLPLVIAHQLGLYFAACKRRSLLESIGPAGFNALTTQLNSLVEAYTNAERLANVGIPTVYGIQQCTSLFLLTLPLVLVELMGFTMIPFVTVVAFTFIGIESIASEIEMPFGVDNSDLPLDLFCAELRNEVEHMISRLPPAAEEFEW